MRDVVAAFGKPITWCFATFLFSSQISLFALTDPFQMRQMYGAESPIFLSCGWRTDVCRIVCDEHKETYPSLWQ